MKAIITIELDYPEQIYDLYETKEIRLYDKDGVYMLWEGGFEIKPMPEKMKANYDTIATCEVTEKVVAIGWNACVDVILGETE